MSEFKVNTYTTGNQSQPSIAALTNGGFVITWMSDGQDGSGWGVYAQRYDSAGNTAGVEFRVNTYTAGNQWHSRIAGLSDGGFIITWVGQDNRVYAQRYDSAGNTAGAEVSINASYYDSDSSNLSITSLTSGGFIITWNTLREIYAQRYDGSGIAEGSAFKVGAYTIGRQMDPSITSLASGGFVITWIGQEDNVYDCRIYAQRYDASGATAGPRFQSYSSAPIRSDLSVMSLTDGGFVMIWIMSGQYISAERYDADGNPAGYVHVGNTYGAGSPRAASLANGGLVITWNSYGQDASDFGVYAQRYDANGNPADYEFRVNTYTTGAQSDPSITSLASGGFVITWQSISQDGGSGGIYAQMYDSEGVQVAQNTLPVSESFSLDTNEGSIITLDFSAKISDVEDPDNLLKIKIKTLPTAGKLYDKNNTEAVVGNTYAVNELVYKETSTTATSDSFAYTVIDTKNAESDQSTVTLNITPKPNTAPTSGALALSVVSGNQTSVNFSNIVSDAEDSVSALLIKIKTLPIAGKLYDKNNAEVVVGNTYGVSELVYKETSTTATIDSFAYTVVDSKNAESGQNTVSLNITPKPNTAPTSGALTLSVAQDNQASVNFTSVVSDVEDSVNALQIRIKTLPIAGKLYDKNNAEVVVGNTYGVSELVYKETSTTATTDSFAYTVVDTKSAESGQSTVTFSISSSDTTSSTAISSDASVISSTSDTATSVTTSSTAISADTANSISTSTSSDAATSQSAVITPSNTPPQSNYFQLKVNKNGTADVKFKSVISDKEDSIDKLQIKINHSPECGKLYNVNKEEITLNQPYSALESMLYEPINCTDSKDSFSYVVVDTEGAESNPSLVNISILEGAMPYVDIAPIVGIVSLPATQETPILIALSDKVSDDHDNFSELKVKIKSQPSCGKVYDKNNQEMVLNQLYNIDGLTYSPSTCAAQTYKFAYSVVDTGGNESKDSEIIIVVTGAGFPSWATAVIAVVGGIGSVVGIGYTAYECYKKLYPDNSEVNSVNKSNGKKEGDGENDYENQYPKLQKNDSPDKTNRIIMDNKELGSMNSSNVMNIGNIVNNNIQQPNAVPISEVRNLLSNNAMADPEQGMNQHYIDPNEIAMELENKIEIGNDVL